MSLSSESFRSHLIWKSLNDLGPLIDQAMNPELASQTLEDLYRLKSVLTFTGKRLAGADPFLLQSTHLDNISAALNTAATQVREFISNGNVAHITAANTHADTVLTYLTQLNVQITTEDFIAAKEAAESYRLGVNEILNNIQSKSTQVNSDVEASKNQLAELVKEIAAERTKLATLTSGHQGEFDAVQTERNTEWQQAEKGRQDSFDAAMSKYEDELKKKEDAFTKFKEEIQRRHEAYVEVMAKEFADSAKLIHEELLERKREVEILVGVIGNLGVTSGHQKAAKSARNAAWIWQGITVLSMVVLIALAIYIFLPQVAGTFSWESFAGRVFITFTVGVLAAYAGSQADKYQKIERYNRNLALELEAIGPYIAPLQQDKQDEFRLKIGDLTFGRHGENMKATDEKSPTSIADVLGKPKELNSLVTEVIKATSDALKATKQ